MRHGQQIKHVAGCLNAAGHELTRALAAAKRVSAEDGHELAQLECAVRLHAEAWRNREVMGRASPPVQTFGRVPSRD